MSKPNGRRGRLIAAIGAWVVVVGWLAGMVIDPALAALVLLFTFTGICMAGLVAIGIAETVGWVRRG